MTDLIAARLDFGGFLAGTTKPLITSGQLKGLAIVAEKRSELVPEIPTTTEQGLSGMNSHGVHFMLFAPAATPKPIVALMGSELKKIISEPSLKKRFIEIGFDATAHRRQSPLPCARSSRRGDQINIKPIDRGCVHRDRPGRA
jgi:tripartite-type tricarboxylate transporter receptor subunit TctC